MEYESQFQRFKDRLIFQEFCQIKENRRQGHHNKGGGFIHNHDLHGTMGRFFLADIYGSYKCTTKSWVKKLDIYFQLNQVLEMGAIKISVLHLEGEAHDWWSHGLSILGHANVTTYSEFTRRLVERFD